MKGEPHWLSVSAVLAIHDRLIAEFGGEAGVRDPALLESALASPRNHFAYGRDDLFDLAEAYASAISRDHPFVDGNKRVALTVAIVFLELNGEKLTPDEEQAVHFVYALAARDLEEGGFANWLRQSCVEGQSLSRKVPRETTPGARSRERRKRR